MNQECIHSAQFYSSVSSANHSACACEDCLRFRAPKEESARSVSFDQASFHPGQNGPQARGGPLSVSVAAGGPTAGGTTASATTVQSPISFGTTPSSAVSSSGIGIDRNRNYNSEMNTISASGFGARSNVPKLAHRRSSSDYKNVERIFTQHSTSCACLGSGVGCDCGSRCDC